MTEWQPGILSDIAEIDMGQSPAGETCNAVGKGTPLLNGPTEFTQKYPIPVQYTIDARKISKEGDILFCVRGSTTGRMNWSDQKYAIGRGLAAIRHRQGTQLNSFLKGILDVNLDLLLTGSTGSTFPNVSRSDLLSIKIFLPPLLEQHTIAEVLSSIDDKLDLLNRNTRTLEQMAEALFHQWFIVEEHEQWESLPLDQVADFLNGIACQKYPPKNEVDRLPVIKIRELNQGFTSGSDWASTELPPQYIVTEGDVLFSWSGSLEVVLWNDGKGILNQHLFKVTSVRYPKWYYYCWLKEHLDEFRSIAASKATTMGHIQRSHLSAAMVIVPPENSLRTMNMVMEPIFEKLVNNNTQMRLLKRMRSTLLPKIMNGEVRTVPKSESK